MGLPKVIFYTRRECHLCDSARFVVERVAAAQPMDVEFVDIDGDAALRERYGWHVPVVLINGVEHARHRLDEAAFRKAIRGATSGNAAHHTTEQP